MSKRYVKIQDSNGLDELVPTRQTMLDNILTSNAPISGGAGAGSNLYDTIGNLNFDVHNINLSNLYNGNSNFEYNKFNESMLNTVFNFEGEGYLCGIVNSYNNEGSQLVLRVTIDDNVIFYVSAKDCLGLINNNYTEERTSSTVYSAEFDDISLWKRKSGFHLLNPNNDRAFKEFERTGYVSIFTGDIHFTKNLKIEAAKQYTSSVGDILKVVYTTPKSGVIQGNASAVTVEDLKKYINSTIGEDNFKALDELIKEYSGSLEGKQFKATDTLIANMLNDTVSVPYTYTDSDGERTTAYTRKIGKTITFYKVGQVLVKPTMTTSYYSGGSGGEIDSNHSYFQIYFNDDSNPQYSILAGANVTNETYGYVVNITSVPCKLSFGIKETYDGNYNTAYTQCTNIDVCGELVNPVAYEVK